MRRATTSSSLSPRQAAWLEHHGAVEDLGGQVLQGADLVARQPCGSQVFCRGGEETFGSDLVPEGAYHSAMDRLGSGAGELLMGHRTNECSEVGLSRSGKGRQSGFRHQTSNDRIALGQKTGRITGAQPAIPSGCRFIGHGRPFREVSRRPGHLAGRLPGALTYPALTARPHAGRTWRPLVTTFRRSSRRCLPAECAPSGRPGSCVRSIIGRLHYQSRNETVAVRSRWVKGLCMRLRVLRPVTAPGANKACHLLSWSLPATPRARRFHQ